MTAPAIAIVIPVYNAAGTVARAVDSALRQRGVSVRVFAVDHGSRDGSLAVLRALAGREERLSVIALTRSPRERLSAARPLNEGFRAAVTALPGCWVLRLDADDVLAADGVLAALLRDGGHRPLIAGLLVLYAPADGTAVSYGPRPDLRDRRSLRRGSAYALGHHSMLARADILAGLLSASRLFDETISYGEDLDVSLRLLSGVTDAEFAFVARPVTYKFLGAGTITSSLPGRRLWLDQARIFARHRDLSRVLFAHVSAWIGLRSLGRAGRALAGRLGAPAARVGSLEPAEIGPVLGRLAELASAGAAP